MRFHDTLLATRLPFSVPVSWDGSHPPHTGMLWQRRQYSCDRHHNFSDIYVITITKLRIPNTQLAVVVPSAVVRPIRIEASPAFAGLEDWDVLDHGKPVGRIYEKHVPARPDLAWFWSITGLSTSGTTATLDEAKAAFRVVLMGGENRVRPDPIMREQLKCHCCGGLACNRYAGLSQALVRPAGPTARGNPHELPGR